MTKKSKILKLLKVVQKRLNVISKGNLHHLAKFQISWPSFTVILGNFQKLEQDENFLEQDMRTTFKFYELKWFGRLDISNSEWLRVKLSWIDDMMTRDDKKSKILKLLRIVQKRLNMISKGILHHLTEFYGHFREFSKNWNKLRIF